jgi:hypothetical protein
VALTVLNGYTLLQLARDDNADETVEKILEGLQAAGVGEALRLADLMQLERHLVDGLALVRREIDLIVRRERLAPPPEAP